MSLSNEQMLILDIARNVLNDSYKIPDINNIVWDKLLKEAHKQKMLNSVYTLFKGSLPENDSIELQKKAEEHPRYCDALFNDLKEIIKLAEKENIRAMVVKGPLLSFMLYGDIYSRFYYDIDILVGESDFYRLSNMLVEYGYHQPRGVGTNKETDKPTSKLVLKYNANFYEFPLLKKCDEFKYFEHLAIEIKRATSAIPLKYIPAFLSNTQEITINDIPIITSDIDHSFLHLCANTYNDTESHKGIYKKMNFRNYVDLFVFINKYLGEIRFDRIRELSDAYEITHKVYYCLNNINVIFPKSISDNIVQTFNPSNISYLFEGNVDGSLIDLNLNIIERVFKRELRISNYMNICREKRWTEKNPYYKKPLNACPVNESNKKIMNINNCEKIFLEKQNYNLSYGMVHDTHCLYLHIVLNNNFFSDMDNLRICFTLYGNNFPEINSSSYEDKLFLDKPSKSVFITKSNDKLLYYIATNNRPDEFYDLKNYQVFTSVNNKKDNVVLAVNIPYRDINKDGNRLCYNVFLQKSFVEGEYQTFYKRFKMAPEIGMIELVDA